MKIQNIILVLVVFSIIFSGCQNIGDQASKQIPSDISHSLPKNAEKVDEQKITENEELVMELDSVNKEIQRKSGAWTAEINKFSDMTLEEKKNYLGLILAEKEKQSFEKPGPKIEYRKDGSLPDFFDWRDQHGANYITPVKNQGSCGSCWAFGVVATLEGEARAYYNNPNLDIDLSEQDLVSCCEDCFPVDGCSGGVSENAFEHVISNDLVQEECFPYVANPIPCNLCDAPIDSWKISGFNWFDYYNTDINEVKRTIIDYGPVEAHLGVYGDFYSYGEGIYQHTSGDFVGGHAVVIVGYGTYDGIDYWIVKNSWGETWGEDGYFRIEVTDSMIHPMYYITSPNLVTPPEKLCNDNDEDGYCYWGLGDKPTNCPASCDGELISDCDDSDDLIFEECGNLEFEMGTLSVESIPSARIYVKDPQQERYYYRGETPSTIILFPGERFIKVKQDGFLTHYDSVSVEQGGSESVFIELEPGYECGDEISEDTILNNDILNCDLAYNEWALKLSNDDITLDCNNHKITGLDSGSGILVSDSNNVEIKNCEVNNFFSGIFVKKTKNSRIGNNILKDNYKGIFMGYHHSDPYDTSGNVVDNNVIIDSGDGVSLTKGADENFITDNYICGNDFEDLRCSTNVIGNSGSGNWFNNQFNCEEVSHNQCFSCSDGTIPYSCSSNKPQYCQADFQKENFAFGQNGKILRFDGSSWSEMNSGIGNSIRGSWGSSPTNIIAVGTSGKILRFDGSSWSEMNSGVSSSLHSVWGSSADNIYSAGFDGAILHFDGVSWSEMNSGTNYYLSDIWGSSASDIIVVARTDGAILRFDNSSWNEIDSGTNNPLNGVWGSSSDNIYAVGDWGTILRFDGVSWSEMDSGTNEHLWDIWGSSAANLYAVGPSGTILRFDGVSWSDMDSGTNEHLSSVWANSPMNIITTGYSGTILRFDGVSWSEMNSGTNYNLYAISGYNNITIELVSNCQECGCPPGKTCNVQTGTCTRTNPSPEVEVMALPTGD